MLPGLKGISWIKFDLFKVRNTDFWAAMVNLVKKRILCRTYIIFFCSQFTEIIGNNLTPKLDGLINVVSLVWLHSMKLTITKKMASCSSYQNALRAIERQPYSVQSIKMTRNHEMRNFKTTKKLTSCLMQLYA